MTSAPDPATGEAVSPFNPRLQRWEEHFAWTNDVWLMGRTRTGQVTVQALDMNAERRLVARRLWRRLGMLV